MMTETLTLADFLLARIAEEEMAARVVEDDGGDIQRTYYDRLGASTVDGSFDRVWLTVDPRRVLAECAAKRRILEDLRRAETHVAEVGGRHDALYGLRSAARSLAAVYADHPDYRDEWRP